MAPNANGIDVHRTRVVSTLENPSRRAPESRAKACPIWNAGISKMAGPIPKTFPSRPVGVFASRYQSFVTSYWLVKSRSPSRTREGRYA
ncbi:MAG: hypothetical protein U0169_15715 [Polyangiaceae bacterium]